MKSPLIFAFFLGFSLLVSAVEANTDKVYSNQGYPYKLLINRADEVKIFYRENATGIYCHVEVSRDKEKMLSTEVQVSAQQFSQKPLASCLPREQAKNLLAYSFSQYL